MQCKLQPSVHDVPIDGHTGATVEVYPLAVTASQVAEKVCASALERGAFD